MKNPWDKMTDTVLPAHYEQASWTRRAHLKRATLQCKCKTRDSSFIRNEITRKSGRQF